MFYLQRFLRLCSIGVGCLASAGLLAEQPVRFNRDVRPILSDKCFACHGPAAQDADVDLRLDLRESAVDVGGVIIPGNATDSELIRRIYSADADEIMPPQDIHKPLDDEERALLRRWIDEGAEYESHWAYTPIRRPTVPASPDASVATGAIDRFVGARLATEGVQPVPVADRITLIRRLSFDLTGMPPTTAEVDAFVEDDSPDAYEKLVDRLLGSPRFGERMAAYWLDLVRYADTVGYHGDQDVSHSPYRDYVIAAFNANMPFDRFIREQLAGDLLPNATLDQRVASGYNRLNQTTEEGGAQPKEYLSIYFADRVRSVSQVFMGATVGCAQCHDHKYDPYTARDFYSLGAFFADLKEQGKYDARARPPMIPVPTEAESQQLDAIDQRITELTSKSEVPGERSLASTESPTDVTQQLAELQAARKRLEQSITTTVVSESVEPRTIRILPRGNWMDESGEVVQPAIPEFLGKLETGPRRATRLDLANWLCEPDNVLTSRTMVNRLWYLMFGRGICTSVDDLGGQGTFPTHPDLLDWLAVEFIESGWDIKHVLGTITTSETYRRSSRASEWLAANDPYNKLLARQGRFPLPAEMVRDNALFTGGLLVEKIGGPSVRPYQPDGYYAQLNFPKRSYAADKGNDQYRRGLYTHWQRTFLHPMLKAFDAPSREECTAARSKSNTPLQALTLLNDPTFVEAARVFAARVMREGGQTRDQQIAWAYRTAVSREPEAAIVAELEKVFEAHLAYYRDHVGESQKLIATGQAPVPTELDAAELAAWTGVARALLNLNETITRY